MCVCVCDGACATLAQKSGSNSSVCRACLSVHVSDMRGAGGAASHDNVSQRFIPTEDTKSRHRAERAHEAYSE